jgi:hypothetical protein
LARLIPYPMRVNFSAAGMLEGGLTAAAHVEYIEFHLRERNMNCAACEASATRIPAA